MSETEDAYVQSRKEAQSRVIEQSMDKKLGRQIKNRDQLNPERSMRTDNGSGGAYSPLRW